MPRGVVAFVVVAVAGSCFLVSNPGWAKARHCTPRVVDDRGHLITATLEFCRSDRADSCFDLTLDPHSEKAGPKIEIATYRAEGAKHGPISVDLEGAEDGSCTVTLPRKAEVTIENEEARALTISFYRPDREPEMIRPVDRTKIDGPATFWVPAGSHLVSLVHRGWAPDLHLLEVEPGSTHQLHYRQKEGWSVVLRAISGSDYEPISGAEVELWTLPGFDVPSFESDSPATPRFLLATKTNSTGVVAISGLRVPLASASLDHPDYLDEKLPAFSSAPGTFRVFEARMHQGGSLKIHVRSTELDTSSLSAVDGSCGLFPFDYSDENAFTEENALFATPTDELGVCTLSNVPAGHYALKVSLLDEEDAYTIEPVLVSEGLVAEMAVELRPIRIQGRVYRGSEGAEGFEVLFGRAEDFDEGAGVYPAGHSAETDETGEYSHVLWSPGEYVLLLTNDSTMAGLPRFVDIRGDDWIDFDVSDVLVEGRVVDDTGSPRPDAEVLVRLDGLTRKVNLDREARFEVPFDSGSEGVAELVASHAEFHDTKPVEVIVQAGGNANPVELVLRRRTWRRGRITSASGEPIVGAWLSVHTVGSPLEYAAPIERVRSDEAGRFEVPAEERALRLFFGGPGCPLGYHDVPAASASTETPEWKAEAQPIHVTCGAPSHLMIRLVADDPELRTGIPMILRRDGVTVPTSVLSFHLETLHLPSTTDGAGRIGLVALEPGSYEVFHGKATSIYNVASGLDLARLTKVHLDAGNTAEIEAVVTFR